MIQVLARLLKWLPGNLSHPYYSHYIIVITIPKYVTAYFHLSVSQMLWLA
jgi:hypothetical protein